MAWICSVESEGLRLHLANGLSPLLTVKSNPTHKKFYCPECLTASYQSLQSGTMCELCQQGTYQKSISFTADSLVRTLALQDEKLVLQKKQEADYSLKSCDLQTSLILNLSSSKTSPTLGIKDWIKSCKKLPLEGSIVDGVFYQRQKLGHGIKGKDGGYWATPNTMDFLPLRSQEALDRQFATTRKGRTKPANLREQVHPQCYPTPTAQDFKRRGPNSKQKGLSNVENFPTPAARDWKDNGKSPAELERNSQTLASIAGGQLNPQWVEWLMGYLPEWTELSPSVIALFPKQRGKRL